MVVSEVLVGRASIFMSRTFSSLSGCFCFLQQMRSHNEGRETTRLGKIQTRHGVYPKSANMSLEDTTKNSLKAKHWWARSARLTYHGWLNEAPGVGLRHVWLEHTSGAPGLVHTSKHVDLPSAHRGCRRMHRFGEWGNRLPLVGYCVVSGEKERIEQHHVEEFNVKQKHSPDAW